MRKILLLVLIISFYCAKAQDIDVLHYNFVLRLNDTSDLINGYTEITLTARQGVSNVAFDLVNKNQDGRGMSVFKAQSIRPNREFLAFRHESDKVTIPLSLKKGDTATIAIWYKGSPSDGLIISKNKHGDRTFFADNWPNRTHHWIPCVDRPDDKASFEFIVEAPWHYQVISNGILVVEHKDKSRAEGLASIGNGFWHWKENTPSPTKVMVIGVAKFATKTFENSPPNLPISAWVYPQDSAKGFYDYALTTDIVKFFSSYIAPFPYKKLANVQSKTIFGGMENAGAIFYAESSVAGDRSNEDLYAHEIAHQWFGDMASEKSFAHLWLSEGFATYLTDIYFENKYGNEAFQKRLQKERDEAIDFAKTSTHAVVDSTTDLMSLLNANSYQKGAWVLHMLRSEVGDSAFHKIIQTYYNQYKGGNAETRDFEKVAEQVSGKNLKWFFDQWLYKPGVPQLQFSVQRGKAEAYLTIKQSQKEVFRFTLNLRFSSTRSNSGQQTAFQIRDRVTKIKLPDSAVSITIDPSMNLLYDGPFSLQLK